MTVDAKRIELRLALVDSGSFFAEAARDTRQDAAVTGTLEAYRHKELGFSPPRAGGMEVCKCDKGLFTGVICVFFKV